uniref:Uncharacterized protein n=1 Tax=Arundo donax TaxID=35708 RepID=A0A0A8YMX1_ARUDO
MHGAQVSRCEAGDRGRTRKTHSCSQYESTSL